MENEQLVFSSAVSSGQGRLANVDYADLQTTLSIRNQVAKIESVSLHTLGGSVNALGQYDMGVAPPQFQVTSQISDIELGEVFRTQMTQALQYVRGRANFNLDLAGSGEDWEAMKPTLQGQGKFQVNQGALVDLNVADEALSNISGIPGLSNIASQNIRKKYPAIFGGKDTEFAELGSQFTFREGKILLDDVHLNAVDYAAQGDGWLDYDQQIDFHGQVILAQNLSKDIQDEVKVAKYISNTQGRVVIPFTLSGTLPEAKPLPDIATLTRQAQQGAVQKGIEAVQKKVLDKILPGTSLLGGETDQASEEGAATDAEDESPPPKPEDLLKEGLKGLFGR
jgi:AsmA protein